MRAHCYVLIAMLWPGTALAADVEIPVVTYHDIVLTRNADPYAITVAQFEQQLGYLQQNGYRPISLRELDAARRGTQPLPAKPVLLTFDDALRSYYVYAFPRLKRYGFPSVVSIVTRWVDDGRSHTEQGGAVLTWNELRTLARAPTVELISHSDNLHRGVAADSLGTLTAAGTARMFDATHGRLEPDELRHRRVTTDLERSVTRIKDELGIAPRAIAWPYGEYDATLVDAAADLGMAYHLTLDDAPTTLATLPRLNRFTLHNYRNLADFSRALTFRAHHRRDRRFVQFDFDAFAAATATEREAILSRLLDRLQLLRVNAIVLYPFSADGTRAYFATPALPVEADLALRVTMAILRRTSVKHMYVRLPRNTGDIAALGTDFMRRHPLHGVIVDGAAERDDTDRLRAALARYRPAARLFVGNADTATQADGRWIELAASSAHSEIRSRVGRFDPATTLFLVRNDRASDDALRAAMVALRRSGARHYGYTPDDISTNQPDARLVVAPLHAHTIAGRGP